MRECHVDHAWITKLGKAFQVFDDSCPSTSQSAREGKPAHQRSPSELAPPLPTPTAPTPKTGNTIPSKTTLASRRLSIATNRVLRFARATTTIRERSIRKPSFRSKNATISRNRTNEKANLLRANQAVLSSAVSLIQRKPRRSRRHGQRCSSEGCPRESSHCQGSDL